MPKCFLVTGASSGIGRAVAERLLDDGHEVVGLARDFSKFPCSNPRFCPHAVDLSDLGAVSTSVGDVVAGVDDMAGTVLCAGMGLFKRLEQYAPREIRAQIELNLVSPILVARALLPQLKRRGGGDLVVIGSESALRGRKRGTVYCASKFGLRGFGEALRDECASAGVRVTLVHPGSVRTPFFDALDFQPGAEAENAVLPEEVAQVVSHVLSSRRGVVYSNGCLMSKVVNCILGSWDLSSVLTNAIPSTEHQSR